MERAHRYCAFAGCSTTNGCGKRLYHLPKDPERCKLWVSKTNNPKLAEKCRWTLYANTFICEDHFAEWCFMNSTKLRLVHNAVPNLDKKPSSSKLETIRTPDSTKLYISPSKQFDITLPSTSHSIPDTSMEVSQTEINTTPSTRENRGRKKYTPRKEKLAKELKKKKDLLRKCKEKSKQMKRLMSSFKKPRLNNVRSALTNANVGNKLKNFIMRQVKLHGTNCKGRRFTTNEKLFSYSIFCKSRSAYRILQQHLQLPSETTLRRFIAEKLSKPGINYQVIESIKEILKNKSLEKRTFALVFDEISLKPKLVYNSATDNVSGFEDLGELGRTQVVANHALVFMLRSLQGKKKLPLCYYFSNGSVSADILKIIVENLIENLEEAHANIRVIICDQVSTNCRLFKLLGITAENPYFIMQQKKIYGIFDPPHLLKTLRRNLMKYDLQTPKGTVSFKHLIQFFNADKKCERQCAPKLTDKHVSSRGLNSMKVSLASQVFSNSVSAGMSLMILCQKIPAEAATTAEFVGLINDLFDSCNGTSLQPLRGKKYHCAVSDSSPHVSFWKKILDDMQDWKFMKPTNRNNPPLNKKLKSIESKSQTGWLLTTRSLILLYETLKLDGFKYIMPRRLNQDCIENFFSRIRGVGGHNTNPTVFEFKAHFKIASVNSLTCVKMSKNCEDDCDTFLLELIKSPNESHHNLEGDILETLNSVTSTMQSDSSMDTHIENFDFVERNILAYLAGYIGRKLLEGFECDVCRKILIDEDKELTNDTMFIYFKEYLSIAEREISGLKYPSKAFLEWFANLSHLCDELFCDILYKNNLIQTIKHLFIQKDNFMFLNCSIHSSEMKEKMIDLSIRLCINIHLRELNREIDRSVLNLKKLRESIKIRSINGK